MFDTEIMYRTQPRYRKLYLDIRDVLLKYYAKLETFFEEHKVLKMTQHQAFLVSSARDHTFLHQHMAKYNKLDLERADYMVATEDFPGKAPPQGVNKRSPILE